MSAGIIVKDQSVTVGFVASVVEAGKERHVSGCCLCLLLLCVCRTPRVRSDRAVLLITRLVSLLLQLQVSFVMCVCVCVCVCVCACVGINSSLSLSLSLSVSLSQ